jgi:hypothetical protein
MNITMALRHLKAEEKQMDSKPEVGKDVIPEDHLLVHLCNLQKLERVAEIGVLGGNLSKRVLQQCESIKEYYAVDPWKVYIESYDREPHRRETKQEWWESIYQKVVDIKKIFPNKLLIIREESIKAGRDLRLLMTTDVSKFDAVYIDSIHDAPNIVNDLWVWLPLIKDYGTICGHDYIKRYRRMMETLEGIFEDDFNFWIKDDSKSRFGHRNQHQGGNWWIHLTPEKKQKYINNIEQKYFNLLFMGNQDEVEIED